MIKSVVIIIAFLSLSYGAVSQSDQSATYTTSYVVIADTASSFHKINEKMQALSVKLLVQIDMHGKVYLEKENIVGLPMNDPDEIYARSYYPRRYSGEFLSIEY